MKKNGQEDARLSSCNEKQLKFRWGSGERLVKNELDKLGDL